MYEIQGYKLHIGQEMKIKIALHLWFWCFCVGDLSILCGQSIKYKTTYAAMPAGLQIREVHDVFQDSRGFIWATLRTKLYRFDGYTFSDFSEIRIPGPELSSISLSTNNYSRIEKLNEKYFYVYYVEDPSIIDLIHIDSLNLTPIRLNQFIPMAKVLDVTPIPGTDKVAVFCKENGLLVLYDFYPISTTLVRKDSFDLTPFRLERLEKISSTVTPEGIAFFTASSLPIICFNSLDHTVIPLEIPFSGANFSILNVFKNQTLYFTDSTQNKLWMYNLKDHSISPARQDGFRGKVKYFSLDAKGNVIIANVREQYFREIMLLPSDGSPPVFFNDILREESKITQIRGDDFLNQIFVSSINGIYIFSNENKQFNAILNKELKNGAFGHVLRGMVDDGRGHLFIAEDGNSLYKMDLNSDTIIKTYKTSMYDLATPGTIKMIGHNIWGIRTVSNNIRQVYCLDLDTEKFKYYDLPIPTFKIRDFEILDSNVMIYLGYDSRADTLMTWRFNAHDYSWHSMYTHTTLNKPTDIFLDKSNRLWIGSESGLYVYFLNSGQIQKVDHEKEDSIYNSNYKIALSSIPGSDHILVGSDAGLFILDPMTLKYIAHFTKEANGISHNYIEALLPIGNDEVFLTTRSGLSLLNIRTGMAVNFYENDGLAHNEFNRFSAFKSSNDKYYFGGINGLSFISSDKLRKYESKDVLSLSRFFRFDYKSGKEINYVANLNIKERIVIKPDDQYFGFDIMRPDYYEPEFNQFQTWLEGYEQKWQNPSNQHQIRFGRLPKGNYWLHLRPFPAPGSEKVILIQVQAHFYQSSWFISCLIFLLLLGGISLSLYFSNKRQKKVLEKQKTEQKFKDLEAAALRAQMNPHFIFNCLSSIQQFIIEHDVDAASKYLGAFSRLIRLALHSSVDGKHSLQDEIDMLENYLGLERLRFGDRFSYQITVEPDLDKEDIYFPPLLIQPFVENALLHGMKNKKEGGKILVSFAQHEIGIHASVTDNGPGYSAEIRSLDSSGHRSVGMTLTKNRLEILSRKNSFFMKPILGPDGKAEGTVAEILIPVL